MSKAGKKRNQRRNGRRRQKLELELSMTPDAQIARDAFIALLNGQIRRRAVTGHAKKSWEYGVMAAEAEHGFWIAADYVWAFVIPQSTGDYLRFTVILEDDGPRVAMQDGLASRLRWASDYPAAAKALCERMADPEFGLALQLSKLARQAAGRVA